MKIAIATAERGMQEVDARVRGAFAVHAPDGTPLTYYKVDAPHAVTHIKTGYSVCRLQGRDVALDVARKLNRFLPEGNFTADDFQTEKYLAFVRQARPMVKAAREATQ